MTAFKSSAGGAMLSNVAVTGPGAAGFGTTGRANTTAPTQQTPTLSSAIFDQPEAAPSSTASNGDSTPCPLLELCPELRLTIWEYVYTADIDNDGTVDLLTARHPTTNLLLVSRSINAEAKKIHNTFTATYWRNTHFAVNALDFNRPERELIQRLHSISDSLLRQITHLTLRFVAIRMLYEPGTLPRPVGTATFMLGGGWPTSYLHHDLMILVGMGVVLPGNDQVTGALQFLDDRNHAQPVLSAMIRGDIAAIFGPATLREQLEWLWQNL